MNSPRYFALIPAAGVGARMGSSIPKQYVPLAGKPMLLHALNTFCSLPLIARVFVVVSKEDGYIREALAAAAHITQKVCLIHEGGATRHQSVLNGLAAIGGQVENNDWVLVHDAARPGLTPSMIEQLIASVQNHEVGGLLALPVVDTLKRAGQDNLVQETVPRTGMWAAQTPQMFRYALLKRALEQATDVTDEASAIEALGLQPKLVEGSPRNFKVTLPHDIALAELYLKGIA